MDYFDQEDEQDYFDFNPTYRIYQSINISDEIMYLQMDSVVCQKQVQTAIEYTTNKNQSKLLKNKQEQVQKERSKNKIEISSSQFLNHKKTRQGWRKQTLNFGKLIKIQFVKQFKKIILTKKLEQKDLEQLTIFANSSGSLKSFKRLFKSQKLRLISQNIYNSIQFIENLLKSKGMQFANKLILFKYIQNLQNLTDDKTNCWKRQKQIFI